MIAMNVHKKNVELQIKLMILIDYLTVPSFESLSTSAMANSSDLSMVISKKEKCKSP